MELNKTTFMFPLNATALILGRQLIRTDHNLSLYCPEEIHRRLAHSISTDLSLEALGMTSVVTEVDTLDDIMNSNFVVFPTLDMDPSDTRRDFAALCQDSFREGLKQTLFPPPPQKKKL